MAPRRKRIFFVSVVLVAGLLIALAVILTPGPDRVPLPNPNGYDDFVKAGTMLNGAVSDYPRLNQQDLVDLVASNREAVALGRLGLSRKCKMPRWISFPTNGLQHAAGIKALAHAFAAEGRLAELEGNNERAVRCYLDAIRLGNESSRGGLMIHRLVGIACQAIGIAQLKRITTNLNCAEIRLAISGLADVNEHLVPWAETAQAERRFMWGGAGRQVRHYRNPIKLTRDLIDTRRSIAKTEVRNTRVCADLRALITDLAVHCYVSEQGRAPESLDRLVPKYLPAVPTDPFTGMPLHFGPQETNSSVF